jgi:hypothetical protein
MSTRCGRYLTVPHSSNIVNVNTGLSNKVYNFKVYTSKKFRSNTVYYYKFFFHNKSLYVTKFISH